MKHLIFSILLCTALCCARPYGYKQSKGHQQFGHRVIRSGRLFELPIVTIENKKRPKFRAYNPITEQRKYNWALIKE